MQEQRLYSFLEDVRHIDWLSHAGEASENIRVVENIQTACDREGARMHAVWEPQTHFIEAQAQGVLGDQEIDRIFATVSNAIHEDLYQKLCAYLDRTYGLSSDKERALQRSVDESLFPEFMDSVKRDVCWAGVEYVIALRGFFSKLLMLYQQGRWPCSWDGDYPEGQPVVL
jgi:hypothetical protein